MTCLWTPDPATLTQEWLDLEDEVKDRALLMATSSLVFLTYNRVGTCPITIRPLIARPGCGRNPHSRDGLLLSGGAEYASEHVINGGSASEAEIERRLVGRVFEIPGPVGYIEQMKIDGAEVDLYDGQWRLDDGCLLVWQGDGPSPMIVDQDLTKPDTEHGTWSLTYSRSHRVSREGQIAVAMLAMEYAKALGKVKGKCSLPRGVSAVVRNGVTFNIEAGLFPNGLTGIDFVDAYILKWAPAGSPTSAAKVFDPRAARSRVTGAVPRPSGW